jgi:hypothetical protein
MMDWVIIGLSSISWLGITFMSFFLWQIARFYEKSSGESAHSWLFIFPTLLLPLGAICYLTTDTRFVGVTIGDVLLFIGGITLLFAAAILQQVMMGER